MITRYNKKTVSIVTDDGHGWNVAPQLLQKVGASQGATVSGGKGNVISLTRNEKHSR